MKRQILNPKIKRRLILVVLVLGVLCLMCGVAIWNFPNTADGKRASTSVYATKTAAAQAIIIAPSSTLEEIRPSPTFATRTSVPSSTSTTGPSSTVTNTPTISRTLTHTQIPTKTVIPTRTKAPTKTPIPSITPTITITPGGAGLPGLWPADVRVNVEDRFGMTCERPVMRGDTTTWTCIRDVGTAVLRVDIYSLGGIQVDIIDAKIAGFFDAETAAKFLGFIATMPYNGAEPTTARLWVANNITKAKAETTIGNVWFELSGDNSLRELIMSKAE